MSKNRASTSKSSTRPSSGDTQQGGTIGAAELLDVHGAAKVAGTDSQDRPHANRYYKDCGTSAANHTLISVCDRTPLGEEDWGLSPTMSVFIPHRGSLRRLHQASPPRRPSSSSTSSSSSLDRINKGRREGRASTPATASSSYLYAIEISYEKRDDEEAYDVLRVGTPKRRKSYELKFERHQYEFMGHLFSILDTDSHGSVGMERVREFVMLRCPVFRRRDDALRRLGAGVADAAFSSLDGHDAEPSPTFDEVWDAVVCCCAVGSARPSAGSTPHVELGVEAWMIFCRYVALAQYQEAKRRFSARHLQQTMRHRNAPRGSEVVVVDVPPPEPPAPISARALVDQERKTKCPLPMPELDLDHSLVSVHDCTSLPMSARSSPRSSHGRVSISVFGPSTGSTLASASSYLYSSHLEFAVTYAADGGDTDTPENTIVVRRSFNDMEWLNDTFTSHRVPGGTLCGRILPPFPKTKESLASSSYGSSSVKEAAGSGGKKAMAAAAVGVGMITSMAKNLWGNYVSPSPSPSVAGSLVGNSGFGRHSSDTTSQQTRKKRAGGACRSCRGVDCASSLHASTPAGKARRLERYLNYLLEHPALSTSFPLNTILKASQSGLDAAKRILEDHAKSQRQQESHVAHLNDGKISLAFWPSSLSLPQQPPGMGGSSSSTNEQLNLSWVRTAAQAAMALKLHGILETTGFPSSSAWLQHASLPRFGQPGSAAQVSWRDEDGPGDGVDLGLRPSPGGLRGWHNQDGPLGDDGVGGENEQDSFEYGVVQVESELDVGTAVSEEGPLGEDDGYDMLPLPVPAPERRILCAGSSSAGSAEFSQIHPHVLGGDSKPSRATRFRYESSSRRQPEGIPGHADDSESTLLGEMSVDNDIDKLREIIGSVDNTLGRCLSASVGIGKMRRKRDALHLDIVRGLDSWEGARGKFIAQRALLNGVMALEQSDEITEESDLALSDDLSWQASLATSAVSAAEDVRSAVRASRTAANAKIAAESAAMTAQKVCETGKFGSVDEARAAQTRAAISQSHGIHAAVVEHEAMAAKRRAAMALAHDVKCWNVHRKRELLRTCREAARSQGKAAQKAVAAWSLLHDGFLVSTVVPLTDEKREPTSPSLTLRDHCQNEEQEETSAVIFPPLDASEQVGSTDKPMLIPVEHSALTIISGNTPSVSAETNSLPSGISCRREKEKDINTTVAISTSSKCSTLSEPAVAIPTDEPPTFAHDTGDNTILKTEGQIEKEVAEEPDVMSSSMQSLVEGLMTWGGQYDSQDDLMLPSGMAASIALEESGIMGNE